ncbi:MAG TPA: glycosyltransferase [Azospirillum sp.]|nr:glycosyltransferase [Azospirillum sp.]
MVDHGVNGFLCETPDEWYQALSMLRRDPGLRRAMGKAGRAKVQRLYTLDKIGQQLVQLLKETAARDRNTPAET